MSAIKINDLEIGLSVSGPDKLLGRTTAGAGGHEELTISGLPAETTPAAGDLLLIEVEGVLKKLDVDDLPGGGSGTVTSASVVSANGLAGTVATATTTPAITLSTTVTGVLKGNGTAISAAVNSDLPAMSATVGGAVPTPPNNTTTFLRGDGTFAAPAGDVVNGGNTGAVVIGTNDATTLSLETNNVVRQVFTGGASTGGALTHTAVTANTSTEETNVTSVVNSSGTPAAGFGQRHLFQLETTTTNAQDAASLSVSWTTATHASRQSAILFSTVTNAGAITELVRMDGRQMKVAGQYASTKFALIDGATIALDWNNGNVQSVTLAGNRTFTFANPITGGRYLIVLKQDATGSRTITWPTIKWRGGTAPTLTTTANKTDLITIVWDGTDYFGDVSLNY